MMSADGAIRPLFGGAIRMVIPPNFLDVANIRPVPDNQEVYMSPDGDYSIVVEILEGQSMANNEVAKYLFDDLADATSATYKRMVSVDTQFSIPFFEGSAAGAGAGAGAAGMYKAVVVGRMRVPRSNTPDGIKNVAVNMVLIRLPQCSTEILATYYFPIPDGADPHLDAAYLQSLQSFAINDWNLFNG